MVLIDYQIPKHPGIIFSKILGLGVEFNPGIPGYPRIPLGPGAQIIWARCCPRHAPDDIFIHCGFPQDFPKWSPSSHLSVSYLISSKRLLFKNIAHDGSFQHCTWLYLALPDCVRLYLLWMRYYRQSSPISTNSTSLEETLLSPVGELKHRHGCCG